MRFQFILLTLMLGLVFLSVDELRAHGGQFKPPVAGAAPGTPGTPGSGRCATG